MTGRALDSAAVARRAAIQVTGNQWWWDVQYVTDEPSLRVTTANEIHVPVGRPVRFDLLSTDVIHSFWVPNLHGKIDLMPGRLNELWLRPTRRRVPRAVRRVLRPAAREDGAGRRRRAAGRFRALACGNRAPAPAPVTAEQQRGKDGRRARPCAMCHTISGTPAGGRHARPT